MTRRSLTDADAQEIRELYDSGCNNVKSLAHEFGVDVRTIHNVLDYKRAYRRKT